MSLPGYQIKFFHRRINVLSDTYEKNVHDYFSREENLITFTYTKANHLSRVAQIMSDFLA